MFLQRISRQHVLAPGQHVFQVLAAAARVDHEGAGVASSAHARNRSHVAVTPSDVVARPPLVGDVEHRRAIQLRPVRGLRHPLIHGSRQGCLIGLASGGEGSRDGNDAARAPMRCTIARFFVCRLGQIHHHPSRVCPSSCDAGEATRPDPRHDRRSCRGCGTLRRSGRRASRAARQKAQGVGVTTEVAAIAGAT
jgi:hypothetical protein